MKIKIYVDNNIVCNTLDGLNAVGQDISRATGSIHDNFQVESWKAKIQRNKMSETWQNQYCKATYRSIKAKDAGIFTFEIPDGIVMDVITMLKKMYGAVKPFIALAIGAKALVSAQLNEVKRIGKEFTDKHKVDCKYGVKCYKIGSNYFYAVFENNGYQTTVKTVGRRDAYCSINSNTATVLAEEDIGTVICDIATYQEAIDTVTKQYSKLLEENGEE